MDAYKQLTIRYRRDIPEIFKYNAFVVDVYKRQMFVQSIKFVEAHSGNKKKVSIYGQEYTNTTFKLAKMNLAIRGISANLGAVSYTHLSKPVRGLY